MEGLRLSVTSASPEETHDFGKALGELLEPGDFIGLIGDLGSGKTQLVRGVAEGAGVSSEDVSSPSFALFNSYSGRIPVFHADLYRLANADELYATGYDELLDGSAAVLVEWLDRIPSAAPAERLLVRLEGELGNHRRLELEARGPRATALLQSWANATGGFVSESR